MTQLDLLSWEPPHHCEVLLFPLWRRADKVRQVADRLECKQGSAADRYWRQTVSRLRGELIRAGMSEDDATAELLAFHHTVQAELQSRAWRGHGTPGGAA